MSPLSLPHLGAPGAGRRPRRPWRVPLVAVAVGLALCGCTATAPSTSSATPASAPPTGSRPVSSTPAPSHPGEIDAAFKIRANAACKPYSDYNSAHPFPFPAFKPLTPDVTLLPQIGAFFDANPANHSLVRDLTALGAPATGSGAWHTWMSLAQQSEDFSRLQIAAAKKSDGPAFVATVRQIEHITEPSNQALLAAGFTSFDPCYNA